MITRIEALVDAFSRQNGFHDPSSVAYRNRNPLLLKAFSEKHERDKDGYRIFSSVASGYNNAINDLQVKLSGKSRCKLEPTNTLKDLVRFFGSDASATRSVKNFLRHALDDENIYENTPLSFFLEDLSGKYGTANAQNN